MFVFRSSYSLAQKEKIPVSNNDRDLRLPQNIPIDIRNFARIFVLIISDLLVIALGYHLANTGYIDGLLFSLEQTGSQTNLSLASVLLLNISFLSVSQAYKRGAKSRNPINLLIAITLAYLSLMLMAWELGENCCSQLFLAWFITLVFLNGYRFVIFQMLLHLRQKYEDWKIKVMLIGEQEDIKKCLSLSENSQEFKIGSQLDLSRFADDDQLVAAFDKLDLKQTDEILICSWNKIKDSKKFLWKLRCSGIYWRILELDKQSNLKNLETSHPFEGIATLRISEPAIVGINFLSKRIFDVIASFILLVVLSLPMLVIALLIKLDSPGPVFYKQTRVGLKGKYFQVWKFRTMVQNASQLQEQLEAKNEVNGGVLFKIKDDPRITKIGKYLRKYSLDELPQLFNVLQGEMSFVGPRPLPVRDVNKFSPEHYFRQEVIPGITGLWQVSGRSDTNSDRVFNLDFQYIQNWSLAFDTKILLKTVQVVLLGKGAY